MYPLGSWFTSCPPSHAPKTRPIIAVHSQAREKVGVFGVYLSRLYVTTVTALLSHSPLPHTLQIQNIYNLPHMTQHPQFLLWHELKTMFWLPSKLGTHSCSIHQTVLKNGHWRSKDSWDCAFPEPDQLTSLPTSNSNSFSLQILPDINKPMIFARLYKHAHT